MITTLGVKFCDGYDKKNRLHLACILLINFALLLGGCSSANEKQLAESICIETSEGCTRVISKGAIIPTSYSEEYSNHEADQDQIGIMLYGGEDSKTESNRLIGEFHISISRPQMRETPVSRLRF